MFAMPGTRLEHGQIVANAMRELGNRLGDGPCQPISENLRVCVKPVGLYTYPDVVVICGKPTLLDSTFDTLLNPTVIIEVLSESTEAYDRDKKFELYRAMESLAEYLMISSRRVRVALQARTGRYLELQ